MVESVLENSRVCNKLCVSVIKEYVEVQVKLRDVLLCLKRELFVLERDECEKIDG